MCPTYTNVDMRDGQDSKDHQNIEVVSFRPDDTTKKFLRRMFRKKEVVNNKSAFHQRVYLAGMKTIGS